LVFLTPDAVAATTSALTYTEDLTVLHLDNAARLWWPWQQVPLAFKPF
jgi:hypothetical protein